MNSGRCRNANPCSPRYPHSPSWLHSASGGPPARGVLCFLLLCFEGRPDGNGSSMGVGGPGTRPQLQKAPPRPAQGMPGPQGKEEVDMYCTVPRDMNLGLALPFHPCHLTSLRSSPLLSWVPTLPFLPTYLGSLLPVSLRFLFFFTSLFAKSVSHMHVCPRPSQVQLWP